MSLTGRVAIVTGSGRGLGRAFAAGLAAEGARIVIADSNAATAAAAAAAINASGGQALAVATDVTDAGQVETLAARTLEHFGGIDILVNNAGKHDDRSHAG